MSENAKSWSAPRFERTVGIADKAYIAKDTADMAQGVEIARLTALVSSSEAERYRSCGELLTRAEKAETEGAARAAENGALTTSLRGVNATMSAIEAMFPDWRSYRDLPDAVACRLHELSGGRDEP